MSQLCPKCGKVGAKASDTYPDILVHRCDGTTLNEVGSVQEKKILDKGLILSMEDMEKKAIENAIISHRGNLSTAAVALGIGRATLYRKVKQYNIDPRSLVKYSKKP